ncbi:MAG: DUF6027 family protein [Nitriliruptoraceae bacterium]
MSTSQDEPGAEPADEPTVRLERWSGRWREDDPYAGLKAEVADHAHLDPLVTLRGLAAASGLPVGALARYVLTRWASGGSEALLELGVSGVDHLAAAIERAEAAGTDAARLRAYGEVAEIVSWLRAGAVGGGEPAAGA